MKPVNFFLYIWPLFLFSNATAQKQWTLQECITRALEKNISINQSRQNSEINRLSLEQSRANRIPDLNLTDGQNFSFGRSVDPFSNQYVDQNVSSNNIALSSTVTLYNGMQNENTIKRNRSNYEAGMSDIEVVKNDISLSVVAAYLQVLLDYEQVDNAKSQLEATSAQVDHTKKYVDVGKFPESNLLQVQSQLATDKYSLVVTENQLQNAKVLLMQLIELPVSDTFEIERPVITGILQPSVYSTQEIYNTALGILPQVKSAGLKMQSAAFDVKIAEGMRTPELSLGASLKTGYSSARSILSYQTILSQEPIGFLQSNPSEIVLGDIPTTLIQKSDYPFADQFKDNFSQLVFLNLSVPIFNNKQVKTGIGKAKAALQIAELNEQGVKNQMRKNIEQAVTDEKAAEKKYAAAKEQLSSEETSYSNLEKKFNLGMISSTDFLVEKNNYTKAKSNEIQSRYEFLFNIKVVDYYMGKSLTF